MCYAVWSGKGTGAQRAMDGKVFHERFSDALRARVKRSDASDDMIAAMKGYCEFENTVNIDPFKAELYSKPLKNLFDFAAKIFKNEVSDMCDFAYALPNHIVQQIIAATTRLTAKNVVVIDRLLGISQSEKFHKSKKPHFYFVLFIEQQFSIRDGFEHGHVAAFDITLSDVCFCV